MKEINISDDIKQIQEIINNWEIRFKVEEDVWSVIANAFSNICNDMYQKYENMSTIEKK